MTAEQQTEPDQDSAPPRFVIDYDGVWWHDGRRIERAALVSMFAGRALCYEDGEYWLKSPKERHRVRVEDVPFIIVDYDIRNPGTGEQEIECRTNIGERFTLGPDHPLIVDGGPGKGVVIFYALVRDGLKARCNRSVNYDLIAHAMEERGDKMVIRSRGESFAVAEYDF